MKVKRRYVTHIGNYSGSLFIEQKGDRFYWGLEDCAYGDSTYEISEDLFDLILLEQEPIEAEVVEERSIFTKEKSIFDEK